MKSVIKILFFTTLVLSTIASAADTVYKRTVDSCSASLESDLKWHVLTLRFIHPDRKNCEISRLELEHFFSEGAERLEKMKLNTTYDSIFLGRIIEYPWMSKYLVEKAVHHPLWSAKKGRALEKNAHELVSEILFSPDVLNPFKNPLQRLGYRIKGVSVEKILVSIGGGPHDPVWTQKKGRVPFDAMIWLTLEKRERGSDG